MHSGFYLTPNGQIIVGTHAYFWGGTMDIQGYINATHDISFDEKCVVDQYSIGLGAQDELHKYHLSLNYPELNKLQATAITFRSQHGCIDVNYSILFESFPCFIKKCLQLFWS